MGPEIVEDKRVVPEDEAGLKQEELFRQAQNQRYEEAIQHCLEHGGFKNRRTAEKWLLKRHNKMVQKFHKQAVRNAKIEKPLMTVIEEES